MNGQEKIKRDFLVSTRGRTELLALGGAKEFHRTGDYINLMENGTSIREVGRRPSPTKKKKRGSTTGNSTSLKLIKKGKLRSGGQRKGGYLKKPQKER